MKLQTIVFVFALGPTLMQVPLLDLTFPIPSSPAPAAATSGLAGGTLGGFGGTLPIAVSIVELEDRPYTVKEQFEFVVELRNTHDAAIVVPWSSDRSLVTSTPDGVNVLEATLSLLLQDQMGRQHIATSVGFFGSAAHPESTRTVMPNETVRIKALGRWQVMGIESYAIFGLLPAPIQVRAGLIFSYGSVQPSAKDSPPRSITLALP